MIVRHRAHALVHIPSWYLAPVLSIYHILVRFPCPRLAAPCYVSHLPSHPIHPSPIGLHRRPPSPILSPALSPTDLMCPNDVYAYPLAPPQQVYHRASCLASLSLSCPRRGIAALSLLFLLFTFSFPPVPLLSHCVYTHLSLAPPLPKPNQ